MKTLLKRFRCFEYQNNCASHVKLTDKLAFVQDDVVAQLKLVEIFVFVGANFQSSPSIGLQIFVGINLHRTDVRCACRK